MKMFKILFVLLVACSSVAGCLNRGVIKGYDFFAEEVVVDHKDMAISAELIGALAPAENDGRPLVTVRSTPYTLQIRVAADTGYYKSIQVSNLVLRNENGTRIAIPGPPNTRASEFKLSLTGYISEISFDNIELPHKKLLLTADVEITTQANSTIIQPVRFEFHPAMTEQKVKKGLLPQSSSS